MSLHNYLISHFNAPFISKTQDDGLVVTKDRIKSIVVKETERMKAINQNRGRWSLAGKLVTEMLTKDQLDDFLTTICYPHILSTTKEGDTVSAKL